MRHQLLDMPPAVLGCWGFTNKPGSTEAMLFLREGFGHHTEILDIADMETWLGEHHPEVFTTDGGSRLLFLGDVPSEILAPCLAYARKMKAERNPRPLLEFGHLVDSNHAYLEYAGRIREWRPGVAVGVVEQDGSITVQSLPIGSSKDRQ